jgi:hypothetical protein
MRQSPVIKRKRASHLALFHCIFLLPVGLADLMGRRYGGLEDSSTGIFHGFVTEKHEKKPRHFTGADSLTGRVTRHGAECGPGQDQDWQEWVNNVF